MQTSITHEYLLKKYGPTLSFQQAAEETGLYWETIRQLCARGVIRTARAGRKWVLTAKALSEYLDKGESVSEPEPVRQIKTKHRRIV